MNDILNEIAERVVIDYANLSGRESANRAEFRVRVLDNLRTFYKKILESNIRILEGKLLFNPYQSTTDLTTMMPIKCERNEIILSLISADKKKLSEIK